MRSGKAVATFVFVLMAAAGTEVRAAGPAAVPGEPDAAMVDSIIRKMESSGALDAALDRALSRQAQRQQQAAQEAEAKRLAQAQEQAKTARPVDAKSDHVRGNATAEVSLIEYTDFECPFCKQFHDTPKGLLERNGGRVNWVIRNFPLPFHDPAARKEALAAECVARAAGNDAYWQFADSLFVNTKSNGAGLPEEKSIERLAQAAGVDGATLKRCMNDDAAIKRVEGDIADGTSAGVSGTPTTVVRDNRTGASEAVVGALPAGALQVAIDRMLAAKR